MAPTHLTMVSKDVPFPPEHAGIQIVTLRRKMAELSRFDEFLFIHIFMKFDKLKIYYELILSKISKNSLKIHPLP
jgi:hypothetical protein